MLHVQEARRIYVAEVEVVSNWYNALAICVRPAALVEQA